MKYTRLGRREDGFTIIELLIATAVLSTILTIVSLLLINVGNLYFKGMNAAKVQDTTRSIVNDLVTHLQLSKNVRAANPALINGAGTGQDIQAICIDTTRYTYVLNIEIGHARERYTGLGEAALGGSYPVVQHVLWRDTYTNPVCVPADLKLADPSTTVGATGSNGTEMISDDSRLFVFSVGASSPHNISVSLGYGPTDIFVKAIDGTPTCPGDASGRFCAAARLQTTVSERLTGYKSPRRSHG